MYSMLLSARGNIDHNENPFSNIVNGKKVEAQVVECNSIEECQLSAQKYILDNDLGGGNWESAIIFEDGAYVGYLSYNGRFWPKKRK